MSCDCGFTQKTLNETHFIIRQKTLSCIEYDPVALENVNGIYQDLPLRSVLNLPAIPRERIPLP